MTVLGYDECHRVLTDPDTFSSSVYAQIFGPIMGRISPNSREPSIAPAVPCVTVIPLPLLDRWRRDLVAVVVDELIDRFASRGRADLVREFVLFVFPVYVIARVMGLPRERTRRDSSSG